MKGVNKVILVGNLGRDPEVRYTTGGTAVTNLRIATSEQWKDKQSGERKESTEWHQVVLFGRLGEIAGEYLKKGRTVYIEGRLQTRKWEKDGIDRYSTEIVANEMQILGSRGGANDTAPMPYGDDEQSGANRPPRAPIQTDKQAASPSMDVPDDFDDDLPF